VSRTRCPSCRGPLSKSQRCVLLVGGTRVASPTRCCGKCCRKYGVLFVVTLPGLLSMKVGLPPRTAARKVKRRSALVQHVVDAGDPRQLGMFEGPVCPPEPSFHGDEID
jgi:hypothetical protein